MLFRSSNKSYNVLIGSPMQLDDRQIVNEAFVSDSIPGLDKQQVIQQAGRWMETIGIQGLGEPQVAALDYATLQEEYEKMPETCQKAERPPLNRRMKATICCSEVRRTVFRIWRRITFFRIKCTVLEVL